MLCIFYWRDSQSDDDDFMMDVSSLLRLSVLPSSFQTLTLLHSYLLALVGWC